MTETTELGTEVTGMGTEVTEVGTETYTFRALYDFCFNRFFYFRYAIMIYGQNREPVSTRQRGRTVHPLLN
jgi:hypothetical protein